MILIRHGESHFNKRFNINRQDPGIHDPGLTSTGIAQAAEAAERLVQNAKITRIVSSPYWRTLQTAEIIASRLNLDITVEPLVRERAHFACDVGSPRSALSARWPEVSFHALPEEWWPALLSETEDEIFRRGTDFREKMIAEKDWRGTLVVTHWGFIRALTGQRVTNGTVLTFDPLKDHNTSAPQASSRVVTADAAKPSLL